ncbi:MAG: hypothetical protein ACFFG0_50000, partial [Candidatus Thorarchaeota archaeon]
ANFTSKAEGCRIGTHSIPSSCSLAFGAINSSKAGIQLRQAGIIASFGIVALEPKWIRRLEEDHKNAKILARGLISLDLPIKIDIPDTNIVIIEFLNKIRIFKIINELGKEGILAFNISKDKIRFVTHYGIQEDDIQSGIETIGKVLQRFI